MQKGYISEKLRRVPFIRTDDSLLRAAELMREGGVAALPVLIEGVPVGLLTEYRLRGALNDSRNGLQAVQDWMELDFPAIPLDAPLDDAVYILQQTEMPLAVVTDATGRYVGVITAADVLSRSQPVIRPHLIGGMATPLGVYLTTGNTRAGAGDVALMLTGVLLFILYIAASLIVTKGSLWTQQYLGIPLYSYLMSPYAGTWTVPDIVGAILRGSVFVVLLGLMRALPIAGTHAAEHKVVHAIERGEPLVLEVVRRMPRVHPRCGTNLAAGAFLYLTLAQGLQGFASDPGAKLLGLLFALMITLLFWRSFGSLLQWFATTKPPKDSQLEAAIRVGEELLQRYRRVAYAEPSFGQRLRNSGLFQILAGAMTAFLIILLLQLLFGITLPLL